MFASEETGRDIFISYCHDDNDEELGTQWIDLFHKYLSTKLRKIFGRGHEPGVWRDKELQGNEVFDKKLTEELRRARILISVLSPSYVGSPWCKREIEEFVHSAERTGGLTVGGHKTRIFKVVKTPVPRDEHPAPLDSQIGYEFFVFDKEKGIPVECRLTPDDPRNSVAAERINDLAYHIKSTLEAIGDALDAQTQEKDESSLVSATPAAPGLASPETEEPVTIYLAETSWDLDEERTKLRRDLDARGYRVLPEGDLPAKRPGAFREAVREALSQCDLSIHLVGAAGYPVTDGDAVTLQNEVAAEIAGDSTLARLVWLPPGLSSTDRDQQRFIDRLQRDRTAQTGAEVLQVPLQELMTVIHDTLSRQKAARTAEQLTDAAASSRPLQVFVDHAVEDKKSVKPLLTYLFEEGYELLRPAFDAPPDKVQQIHERNLAHCDAALLFQDQATSGWLEVHQSELQRSRQFRDRRPMRAQAIYFGPHVDDDDRDVLLHGVSVLEGAETFTPDTLSPFVAKLGGSGGHS